MKNGRNIMKKLLFIILIVFLLTGCGISQQEKNQMKDDIHQANDTVITYIREKYNIEAKVLGVYGTTKTFALSTFYDGDIIVKLDNNGKVFYAWINEKDRIYKDTYQNEQVKEDLYFYIESVAKGKVMNIKLNTYKGQNEMNVLKDDINNMFHETAFMDIKYEKKELLKYIENIDVYVETVGSDLNVLNTDIQKLGKDKFVNGYLINLNIIDFVNDTAYNRVKEKMNVSSSSSNMMEYGVYIDESISPEYDENAQITISQHIFYKKDTIDNIKYSYPEQKKVSIERVETKTIYEKILQEMDTEDTKEFEKLEIDKIYYVKGDNTIVSFAMAFQKKVDEDNFFIYSTRVKEDGEIFLYNNNMEESISYQDNGNHITCVCFENMLSSEYYILIGEK